MRQTFSEFYPPSPRREQSMMQNAIIIFDANVLLDLYRYSPGTRKQILDFIEEHKDQIWIPHQFAFEFQKKRLDVIITQETTYDKVFADIREVFQKLTENLKRHPSLDIKKLKEKFDQITTYIESCKRRHPSWSKKDEIHNRLTKLFKGRVGQAFSVEEHEKHLESAKKRYDEKMPPGYMDSKKTNGNEYGDYIGWMQILAKAKKDNKDVILFTDDRKEDWWQITKGRTIGPRFELIREFKTIAGKDRCFLLHSVDAISRFASGITKDTLQEVETLAKEKNIKDNIVADNIVSSDADNKITSSS